MASIALAACPTCAAQYLHSTMHPSGTEGDLRCSGCDTTMPDPALLTDDVFVVFSYLMAQVGEDDPERDPIASGLLSEIAQLVRSGQNPMVLFEDAADPACPLRIASKLGISASALHEEFESLGNVTLPGLMVWVTDGL